MKKLIVVMAALLLMMSTAAFADTATFTTSLGTVQFTTSANTVTVVLNSTVIDPNSVAQNISGVSFVLSTGQTSASLVSGTGVSRTVNADGTFTDAGTIDAGWKLSSGGTGIFICDIGCTPSAAGPAHTIIGDPGAGGKYTGGGSIVGNGPHNPFLHGTVTFVLTVPGVTADSKVTDGQLYFGTAGDHMPLTNTPEPASLFLLGTGLVGLGGAIRKKICL